MSAKVFIVMTTKNRDHLVLRAISSVIRQTFKDWEMLVINDNSTDGTEELLADWISDPRVQVVKNSLNKNHSILKQEYMLSSTNKYLAVLDDDDYWADMYLESCVSYLDSYKDIPFVYTNCWLIDQEGKLEEEDTSRGYPFPDTLPSLTLHRGDMFRNLKGWDLETYRFKDKFIHAEIDYYLRASLVFSEPVHIKIPLAYITRTSSSMGASRELNVFGTKKLMEQWELYFKDIKVWSILNARLGITTTEWGIVGTSYFKEAIKYNKLNIEAWGALILSSINRDLFLWCYNKYRKLARRH